MARGYYAIGTTLAGMVNLSTYFTYPPKSVRNSQPVPLAGGVRRRALSGRMRASGAINGVLLFDYMPQAEYEAFMFAVFGGFDVASVQRYFMLFDESGHYSPFSGWIERPTIAWETDKALTAVAFPLHDLALKSVTKTTATLTASERLAYSNSAGGNTTITLMAASAVQANTVVSVQKTAAANTVSVARGGSDTINGATSSLTLTALGDRVDLVSDGVSAWVTL